MRPAAQKVGETGTESWKHKVCMKTSTEKSGETDRESRYETYKTERQCKSKQKLG